MEDLLRGLDDKKKEVDLKSAVKSCLEVQMNLYEENGEFSRYAVPIVRRVFASLSKVFVGIPSINHKTSGVKEYTFNVPWSIAAMSDIKAQNNLDVEAEYTSIVAEEIRQEISNFFQENESPVIVFCGLTLRSVELIPDYTFKPKQIILHYM